MKFEDLKVGESETLTKIVGEADIEAFAELTGDTNPAHLDEDYARGTVFKQRIAHGMLSAGYISAVIGTKLPGPGAIYMSQTLKFRAPVHIDDEVVTRATIAELIPEKKRIVLNCECLVDGKPVVTGEATIMFTG